jgi:hypothetical protein
MPIRLVSVRVTVIDRTVYQDDPVRALRFIPLSARAVKAMKSVRAVRV